MCADYSKIMINMKIQRCLIPIDFMDSENMSEESGLRSNAHINSGVRGKNGSSELFCNVRDNQPSVNIAMLLRHSMGHLSSLERM